MADSKIEKKYIIEREPYIFAKPWQGMKWDYDYFTAMKKMLNEPPRRRDGRVS